MKKLQKLVEKIGKYGDRLVPSKPQNKWIVDEIRTVLDKKMSEHSSKPQITQHFSELFCGLEKITEKQRNLKDPLDPSHTEDEIIDAFDSRYFRGESTFKFTNRLLADPRVKNVDHFSKAVSQGGTILRSWTTQQREMFQLHVTNKLWILNRKEEARNKLSRDYSTFWRDQLNAAPSTLSKTELQLLARALVATRALPLDIIMNNAATNWRSLFVIWQNQVLTKHPSVENIAVQDTHLWQALQHVYTQIGTGLPEQLTFVPSTPADAPRQIRSRLLRYAQKVKDSHLLDLLLASSEGRDKFVEVGILATKLTLA